MPANFQHIIVPIDFSVAGNNALKTAIRLCTIHQAVLHLVHVVENSYFVTGPEPGIAISAIADDIEKEAGDKLNEVYESIIKNNHIAIKLHLPTGIPYDEICKVADQEKAGLIVMGTHGISGVKEFFMGTTAFSVIKNTAVPVLTIPANFEATEFKKILFPVRPVPGVAAKYHFVQSFLSDRQAAIHIAVLCQPGDEEMLLSNKAELNEIITSLEHTPHSSTKEFSECASFASHVLEMSRQQAADLIVINATLDYKWTEFFTGPYTQQVVNHSTIPVLSFRHTAIHVPGTGNPALHQATLH